MRRISVYLSRQTYRSRSGYEMTVAECRLGRFHPSDQLIAEIRAPFGSRIRRTSKFGPDELLVRRSPWPWTWFFNGSIAIPAKYLVEDARRGNYGLSLVPSQTKAIV